MFYSSLLVLLSAGLQAQAAATRQFTLQTTYDASNFFDKFNFRDVSTSYQLPDFTLRCR